MLYYFRYIMYDRVTCTRHDFYSSTKSSTTDAVSRNVLSVRLINELCILSFAKSGKR